MDKLEDRYFEFLKKTMYLDESRQKFAKETFKTLYCLVNGRLKDFSSFRRLLLGSKGVGKTILLKKMQEITGEIFQDLITIYYSCDYKNVDEPCELISNKIGSKKISNVNEIDIELAKQNKFVFLVYDELQFVFSSPIDSTNVISQLVQIGGSHEGRIHCIISGNSSKLRRLCFRKLKDQEKKEFPNYIGLDLNRTKYMVRWISPFLHINDFRNLVDLIERKIKSDDEYLTTVAKRNKKELEYQIDLAKMYLSTNGSPRFIESYLIHNYCDPITNITKNIDGVQNKILEAIFALTRDLNQYTTSDEFVEIDALQKWTEPFDLNDIIEKLDQNIDENILPHIYDLADKGFIYFVDGDPPIKKVGLASPMTYLELALNKNAELNYDEILAFKYPLNEILSNIAEIQTLKFLAQSSEKWLEFKLTNNLIQNMDLNDNKNLQIEDNLRKIFKLYNGKDNMSGDGVLIEDVDSNNLVIHRLQIMLGHRININLESATKIMSNFSSKQLLFEQACESTFKLGQNKINILKTKYYLVTTRSIDKEAQNFFDDWKSRNKNEIVILDSEFLSEFIWPNKIKILGKPYCKQ